MEYVIVVGKYGLNIVRMCSKIWVGSSLHLLENRLCMLFSWVEIGKSKLHVDCLMNNMLIYVCLK